MKLEETINAWVNVLFERLSMISLDEGSEPAAHKAASDVLTAVYAVGHEAGRDAEKLQLQLGTLGKPQGN